MSVLILKNTATEGPGTIEGYLKGKEIECRILEVSKGETISDIAPYSHLLIMGGPMAVYEMKKYPFLSSEAGIIDEFIEKGRSVLGICLGAQLLAHVLGARVYPGSVKEIGWFRADLTPDGMADPAVSALIAGHARRAQNLPGLSMGDEGAYAEVFQWHGDTFDLPDGSVRIAASPAYPNQAFRYGESVYGLQFHIEVTPQIIREWFEAEEGVDLVAMLDQTERIFPAYFRRASGFYDAFF